MSANNPFPSSERHALLRLFPLCRLCLTLVVLLLTAPSAMAAGPTSSPGPWVSDQGDGTYRNPVIFADCSDLDAIRVGDDYWLTASSFNHVPGLPILHSKDLVNWTIVNHALPKLVPEDVYSKTRHAQGVYAPSIRHHDGKFWIFYPDPDYGIYVVTATDPRGKWSEPVLVQAGRGYIDPCPFWDDDGKAYLVCAWAGSRGRRTNLLTLFEMSPDGTKLLDEGKTIINGRDIGWKTVEGPKLYKRDGYYWVFAPAGGVGEGFQGVFRAKNIWGPYENRNVLDKGTTKINGPHQGAWVNTPKGENWFLHFQKISAYGRVLHLQPMQWREDGWPVMGDDPDNDGKGEPVLAYKKPALPQQPVAVPVTSDEFDQESLGLQWQWEANPRAEWWRLNGKSGSLRLNCVPRTAGDTHQDAPNLLMQKFPAPTFTVATAIHFSPKADGDTAGLIVFGRNYAWLGLRQMGGRTQLQLVNFREKGDGKEEITETVPMKGNIVFLRVSVLDEARCRFEWSEDGKRFTAIGKKDFTAVSYAWVGAKVGIFASAAPDATPSGGADFDWFQVSALKVASVESNTVDSPER